MEDYTYGGERELFLPQAEKPAARRGRLSGFWNGVKARLIFQCAVCAVFLAIMMMTSVFRGGAADWIKKNVAGAITESADWAAYGRAVSGFITQSAAKAPSEKSGEDTPAEEAQKGEDSKTETKAPAEGAPKISVDYDPTDIIRVDEGVLNSLQSADDPYMAQPEQ